MEPPLVVFVFECGRLAAQRQLLLRSCRKNFGGMALGLYAVPDFFGLSVRPDEEGAAGDAHERSAHEFFYSPSTVGFDRFVFRIAQQREIELLLFLESRLCFHGIGAYPKDNHTQLIELRFGVTKLGRFDRSTGCIGFWKEKKEHALASEVFERDFSVLICLELKIGSLVADSRYIRRCFCLSCSSCFCHVILVEAKSREQPPQNVVDCLRVGLAARGAHDLAH